MSSKNLSYDCKRIKKLLSVFDHHYRKKEMRRMKKRATPLYTRVLRSVNVFLTAITTSTPIWRVFSVKKDSGGKIVVKPLLDSSNIVVCEEKSISSTLIQKRCNEFLPELAKSDDRTKLYHLIKKGHLECMEKERVYKMNKSMNSCIVMDHATEFAQFIRDKSSGPSRMLKKLGNFIYHAHDLKKNQKIQDGDKVAFLRKRILEFSDEIIKLVKEEGNLITEKKPIPKKKKKEEEKKEETLTEISADEAIHLLEGMMHV